MGESAKVINIDIKGIEVIKIKGTIYKNTNYKESEPKK